MSPEVKDAKDTIAAAVNELVIAIRERDEEIESLRYRLEEAERQLREERLLVEARTAFAVWEGGKQ